MCLAGVFVDKCLMFNLGCFVEWGFSQAVCAVFFLFLGTFQGLWLCCF